MDEGKKDLTIMGKSSPENLRKYDEMPAEIEVLHFLRRSVVPTYEGPVDDKHKAYYDLLEGKLGRTNTADVLGPNKPGIVLAFKTQGKEKPNTSGAYLEDYLKSKLPDLFPEAAELERQLNEDLQFFVWIRKDEPFVFAFLKKFRIASYDDYFTKEDTIKWLMTYFSDIEAENIFNSFHAKLNSDWLGKEITRAQLIEELNRLKINTNNIDLKGKPVDASTVPQVSNMHFLKDASATFSQKLDYLLRLINQDKNLSKKEILQAINIIASDDTLSWHFLKNLNDPNWFPRIKDNVIKAIVEQTEDSAAKFQLLNFFEKCAENYSDEIVPFLYSLEKNTQSYQILSSLLKTLSFLKPKSSESIKLIWTILTDLVEHQHPPGHTSFTTWESLTQAATT